MPEAEAELHMAKPKTDEACQPCSPIKTPLTFPIDDSRERLLLGSKAQEAVASPPDATAKGLLFSNTVLTV